MKLHSCYALAAVVAISVPSLAIPATAQSLEESAKIIAAQLLKQGIACSMPRHATRDAQRSKPNENVWVVRCDEATYRVTLIPRRQAEIVPISTEKRSK